MERFSAAKTLLLVFATEQRQKSIRTLIQAPNFHHLNNFSSTVAKCKKLISKTLQEVEANPRPKACVLLWVQALNADAKKQQQGP